ncbi:glutamate-rich protein 1 [Poeciliopsis prolifica]|uniref:glutamate-rich protein 1 n=1 Tax=Poeciliopsis prolifica TaxID=188132 RepID=UPI0024138FF3|nr:glutamate-rich protein 1 [Poeciliopsis prolifica]
MAHRKEVFKSKVLQKLYPAITTEGKEENLSAISEDQATTTHVKRTCGEENAVGDTEKPQNAASQCRRMYTVLPPPQGYNVHAEKSVTLFQLESVNREEDPAEESVHRNNEKEDEEKEMEDQKRKKRKRKKKKPGPSQDSWKDGPPVSDGSGQSQVAVDRGSEHISRNKKRKLKKKRHKEKLLSFGLMTRAAALEFTYSRDAEEEEDNQRKAAEVSEFLKTTLEIYLSDSSPHGVKFPHLSATVDGLLMCLESGSNPNSVLNKLYSLKKLVQQNQADSLELALAELNNDAYMSEEEANAVVSLFKYWITEILPMQRDKEARLLTTQQ